MLEPVIATKIVKELIGVAKYLHHYIRDVKEAPERSLELRKELANVRILLEDLQHFLTSPSTTSSLSAGLESAITEFKDLLEHMKARVDQSQTKGLKKLKWPFKNDENIRLLSKIERYKGTFELAVGLKSASELHFLCL
jgi:hypothetical protein